MCYLVVLAPWAEARLPESVARCGVGVLGGVSSLWGADQRVDVSRALNKSRELPILAT